jgi:leucyl-tRNA synthetase
MEYNFSEIEAKWAKYWAEHEVYKVSLDTSKPKFYILDMFPYPSGSGLHVGHPLGYVASDIVARFKKMNGFNVLHPMGYDAFGLPAEQYAVETGTHPEITTEKAIVRYREQLDKIGFNYDWSRQVKTSDPKYYKWTQWMFIQLFNSWYNRSNNRAEHICTLKDYFNSKGTSGLMNFNPEVHPEFSAEEWNAFDENKQLHVLMHYRLAYQSFSEVNWCPALGTVLANDEIKDGKSERGGYPVEKKKMRQWSLRITEYSDRLLEGLDRIEWSDSLKEMQRNWIGKSEGALIRFALSSTLSKEEVIEVFTTRPDTIFGATFLVIAPEHELVSQITTKEQKTEIDNYIAYVKSRSDIERQQEKKVTGSFTGAYGLNPFNGKKIPVYIAEYVLAGYGTGAIMAVPADDERDKKFAEKFGLEVIDIVDKSMHAGATIEDKVGKMINSEFLNGIEVLDAIQAVISKLEEKGIGKRKVNYKQRDAGFSRQRYWGEPIPVRYDVKGEVDSPFADEMDEPDVAKLIDEKELPLILPHVDSIKPSGDGRSPLANNKEWVAKGYETDTMPGYAGSSWYFLRYMDPHNENEFASKESLDYWGNVDVYFGGSEHAVGHLLYSRFWHKLLFDLGYVKTDEPFKKLVNQGMIQGKSGFVYRLGSGFQSRRHITKNSIPFNELPIPNIFVTKEIFDKYECGTLSKDDVETIEKAKSDAKRILIESKIDGDLEFKKLSITKLNEFAHNFDDDVLKIDSFKNKSKSRLGNEYSIFISNENGDVLTEREVEKMSKSKYNVVNPDDVITQYGADCFRMFEMFLGPIEQSKPWDDKGISGVSSFLRKFWRLFYSETLWKVTDEAPTEKELKVLHKCIKKISEDIEKMSFNTSVSQFMITVNELQDMKCNKRAILEPLVLCLAPFAPFTTEELWHALGHEGSVHHADFPKFDAKYLVESEVEYPVSINGKTRASITLPNEITQEEAWEKVSELEIVQKWMEGKPYKKFVFVKGRIINIVV